jgi:hypothetical protein
MTVRRLLSSTDSAELAEWQAWMILQREDQQRPRANDTPNVEGQLMQFFGKPDG